MTTAKNTETESRSIYAVLSTIKQDFKQPKLNATNPHFKSKYVTLAGVVEAIDSQITKKGIFYNQSIPHFKSKYVTLAGVVEAIDSQITKKGIFYNQSIEKKDDIMQLRTTIFDEYGDKVDTFVPLTLNPDPQKQGSALMKLGFTDIVRFIRVCKTLHPIISKHFVT